jgi:hypothetical protein
MEKFPIHFCLVYFVFLMYRIISYFTNKNKVLIDSSGYLEVH